jgi:hypothetical protein
MDSDQIVLSAMLESKGAICVSALSDGYSGDLKVGDFIVSSSKAPFGTREEAYELLDLPSGSLKVRRAPGKTCEDGLTPVQKKLRPAVPKDFIIGRA